MLCTRMYAAYELVDKLVSFVNLKIIRKFGIYSKFSFHCIFLFAHQWYVVVNKVFATKNPWHLNL